MQQDPGIFIGARIAAESAKLIRQYAESLGLPRDCLLPMREYHISIMYSKQSAAIDYPLWQGELNTVAVAQDIRYIGKAIAILVTSPWLRWRFQLAKACGIESDFSGFIPHLSLCYDPPKDLPIAWYPKPKFPIILTKEYTEAVK